MASSSAVALAHRLIPARAPTREFVSLSSQKSPTRPRAEEIFPAGAVVLFHRPMPPRQQDCEEIGVRANGSFGRTIIPENRKNTSHRDGKIENGDWLAAQISQRSVAEVVASTGMTEKAVQNMRRRKSKISFDNLVDLCRDDPAFAAAFAEYVGLLRPGEAEFAGAITNAFNVWQRKGQVQQ